MKKRLLKISKIIICILVLIAVAILIGFVLQNTYYKKQLSEIKPYGKIVEVDKKKMHVYSMGTGEETIVLLPGHGVPLPSADFAPLMRELSKKYRVVTLEYFGYGFSDKTDKPCTSENYMNEIRTALKEAGIKPPYILMPHSISGVYSEYYAAKHPEEVKGLILLDSTITAVNDNISEDDVKPYKIAQFIESIGLQRLELAVTSQEALEKEGFEITLKNGYTQKEIRDYKEYMSNCMNNTVIEQVKRATDCIKEVKDLPFPSDIPVLKIISKQALEEESDGLSRQMRHINRLGSNARYVVLEGNHFIYHSQLKEISRLTNEFIGGLK